MTIQNKNVWVLWLQGFDKAPEVVELCLESWRRLNPGWNVEALDHRALVERVGLEHLIDGRRSDITQQKISAIGRAALLRRHGGVWADATLFCRLPLDEWLPRYMSTGFFAFRNERIDRLAPNWLLAGTPDNALVRRMYDEFVSYWETNRFADPNSRRSRVLVQIFSRLVVRRKPWRTRYWFSFVPTRIFRIHPYRVFHYMFNKLVLEDEEVSALWQATPSYSASPAMTIQRLASHARGLELAKELIDEGAFPTYKLTWRVDHSLPYWQGVYKHLWATLPPAC